MHLNSDILLVGADGYIGSNCPFECHKSDIRSRTDFFWMTPKPYSTIIFLAAKLDASWNSYLYNDALHTRLDEWLKLYPDIHVIYASSAAIYGESYTDPCLNFETDLPKPINLYGESKLAGEQHVREYNKHTVLRFANVYGKMDGKEGHGVTEYFQGGGNVIYGDGNQVRDFVPVSKIWQVIQSAIDAPDLWHGVFNVSLSKPITINSWFEKFSHGDAVYEPEREGDIKRSALDNKKMKVALAAAERDRE